jgi:hypothetical protein
MDLRLPTGAFFTMVGLILVSLGLFMPENRAALSEANVNLYSGLPILAFGTWMLLLAWRAARTRS